MSRRRLTAAAFGTLIALSLVLPGSAALAQAPTVALPVRDLSGRSVIEWTDVAFLAALDGAMEGAPGTMETVGIVQAAVHDAVATITGDLEPFIATDASWPGARTDLAIGAAARTALLGLFPEREAEIDAAWGRWVNEHTNIVALEYDPNTQHGIRAGVDAARRVLATLGR